MGQSEPWNRALISLDDATMDHILDDLTERAGLARGTSALNLARWDLKAVLREHSLRGQSDPS